MQFRPCIDIHNGQVKQIVGSSLSDANDYAKENFVSVKDASYYAKLYEKYDLRNGHIILLNAEGSQYFDATRQQALSALQAYPGGMQIGGGINEVNALQYLDAGASHVIVTSYIFDNGQILMDRLRKLRDAIGAKRIVIDLSCRKVDDSYVVMTNRWQTFSKEVVDYSLLDKLSEYCDEFLIHAVDVEGMSNGIEEELVRYLAKWNKYPITYAGGIRTLDDIIRLKSIGDSRIHATVGSALEIFGGNMKIEDIIREI